MTILDKKQFIESISLGKRCNEFQLPLKVYKFISFGNDESLNEIKATTFANNQGYLSSPLNFNDPYDCQLNLNIFDPMEYFLKLGLNREERRKVKNNKKIKLEIEKDKVSLSEEILKEWEKFRSQILVCCFTEEWDNFLMWSHYANTYNGICIEYDTKSFLENKYMLLPVLYTDKLIDTKDYINKQELQKEESV